MSRYKTFFEAYPGLIILGFALWTIGIVTPVTIRLFFFTPLEQITAPVATCYVALVGLPFAPALWTALKDRLPGSKINQ